MPAVFHPSLPPRWYYPPSKSTLPVILEQTVAPTELLPATETPAATETATKSVLPSPTTSVVNPTNGVPTVAITPLVSAATSGPSPTLSATDFRTKLGAPTATDPMDNATKWFWPSGVDSFTNAVWQNGSMVLTGLTTVSGWRMPQSQTAGNMYVEMTAKSGDCSGNDNYGIIFRVPDLKAPVQGYLFGVSCEGQYGLWKWDGKAGEDGTATRLIAWKANSAILTGKDKTNRLGVWANGNSIQLYVNGVFLGEALDSSFGTGYFGVFVNPGPTAKFTIAVDEVSYWINPKP